MKLLKGKVAVITGAGRGIGRAVALAFAGEGAALGLAARTALEIETAAAEMRAQGAHALAIPCDVTRQEDVDRLFFSVQAELGPVDILVNNAAISGALGMFWETSVEEWQQIFEVNVIAAMRCCRAVLPTMIARQSGKIINVGSIAGWSDQWASQCHEQMVYGASKAALMRFSLCLSRQVSRYGINVNCVGVGAATRLSDEISRELARQHGQPPPPSVAEIPPEKRVLPEENAGAFVFLASALSDHTTGAYFEANSLPDLARR